MKLSWIELRNLFLLVSVVSLFIGLIFLIIGLGLNLINLAESAKWLISIGVATVSIGIACHSVVISEQSDEKLRIIEKMNFNRLRGLLVERRLSLRGKMLGLKKSVALEITNNKSIKDQILIRAIYEFEIYYSFSIWQSLVYLRQINDLKNRLTKKEKKLILHIIRNLFVDLKEGLYFLRNVMKRDYNIDNNYTGQIQSMFDIIKNFNVHDEEQQFYEDLIIAKKSLKDKIVVKVIQKKPDANKSKKKTKTKKSK